MTSSHYVSTLFCMLALTGCDKPVTHDEKSVTQSPVEVPRPSGNLGSYEIVTQTRPESFPDYFKVYQASHSICRTNAEFLKMPAAASLATPKKDFVADRTTYISDGSAFLMRREDFMVDMSEMTPELGCKSKFVTHTVATLVREGKQQSTLIDVDGKREIEPIEDISPDIPRNAAAPEYTVRRQVNGIALRCIPNSVDNKLVQDMCVTDLGKYAAANVHNKAIVVHARNISMEAGGIVLRTEPVLAKFGKPIDAKLLQFEQAN